MAVRSNRIFAPGNSQLILYLTFLSSFAPLSTDMYLPALPSMAETLSTTDELVSYSMTSFFFVYAFSTLFWGPVSDRRGRKPVLVAGSLIYIISCTGIAFTNSIWMLLFLRGLQAIGCGAASAMSLAIVKDIMRGNLMEKIVSFMQAAHVLAPLCSPLIGGAMLTFTSWRGIFWAQTLCGVLSLAGAFCLRETCRQTGASLKIAFGRIGAVLKNPAFLRLLIIFSVLTMPFMAYLAVSSFAYQIHFKLSPQAFSIFFAMNAGFSMAAPLSHIFILRRFSKVSAISWEMFFMLVGGVLILVFGNLGPWWFASFMFLITFCGSAIRPPSTVLLLQANRGDNGAVAALIQFGTLLLASFSMLLAPLPFWDSPIIAIGAICAISTSACFIYWLMIKRAYQA